ncbi:hypothetical protein DB347_21655 [Opitutaceae bacterium EW11]|nr:hypothetical protein DB347_21655 [Opitutaceae bacterium EW11]
MKPAITESAVKALAAKWYRLLDVHAPMVDVLPLLSDAPEMVFPEVTLTTLAGFEGWFQRVIRIFFDEVHTLKVCDVTLAGDEARVKVVVEWQASMWSPPDAKSKRIVCDADQDWIVRVSPRTGELVIGKYVVNGLKYHPGSATL